MDLVGKAKRVRIYVNEGDLVGHEPAHIAILSLLRKADAAGATVSRGTEGFGSSGVIHTVNLADVMEKLPIVIEWIDSPERVERLLPRVKEMVPRGMVTIDETEVILYKARGVRDVSAALTAADVMARDIVTAAPDTPVREIVEKMVGRIYRAVPVVEGGKPIGIITNSDLTTRGNLSMRLTLLNAMDVGGKRAELDRLANGGKTARDVMTPGPVTVPETMSLPDLAKLMTARHLKRLPVVDASGNLRGIVSRLDLLRTVVQAFPAYEPASTAVAGLTTSAPVSTIMRPDVPTVRIDTRVPEVFQAVVSTRLHRAVVIDADGRVLGVISDAELLQRVTPALHPSAIRSLMHKLPFGHGTIDEHHASARQAGDLMTDRLAMFSPETSIRDVIATVVTGSHKLVVVVDRAQRLLGVVDRADLLRGMLAGQG